MRVRNPHHQTAVEVFAEARKAQINAYLLGRGADEYVTFAAIRADHPTLAADLTDGMIAEICQRLGIDVADG